MSTKQPTLKQKEIAAKKALEWAGAGDDALALATQVEHAAITGEVVPMTPKNIRTTIRGAIKMFFDGNITDNSIIQKMATSGLDMNDLRRSLVEQTVARAIPNIVNKGDIERLAQLGIISGETEEHDADTITKDQLIKKIYNIAEQSDQRTQAGMFQWIYNEISKQPKKISNEEDNSEKFLEEWGINDGTESV